ncbi:MAG: NADPH:quinone reductase-like Zn-dependent oxidoreductase, partial [Kiritimatiellia bacterium]
RRKGVLVKPGVFVPGYDVAGIVEALGSRVDPEWMGRRVTGMLPNTGFGGYASHVCTPTSTLATVADNIELTDAVALALNYITAYQILHRILQVGPHSKLLVHGGAGGVGTASLQLARLLGTTVWSTASAKKHHIVRSLGATPIDYRSERFEDVLAAECPEGVNGVLDAIGGEHLRRSWSVIRPGGTLVSFGLSGDIDKGWGSLLVAARVMMSLRMDRSKRLAMYMVGKRDNVRDDLQRILNMAQNGDVEPIIGAKIPLERVREAHDLIDRSAVIGKIVLTHTQR